MSPSTPLAFQMLDDGPHEMFAIYHPVQMIDVVHLDGARSVVVSELGWCVWTGQHWGHCHYYPTRPYSEYWKDKRLIRFVRRHIHGLPYTPAPPRTSPSSSRPGKGYQRSRAKVPTTRQDGGGLQRRTLRKRAVAALGASRISTWNKPSVLNSIP